MIYTIKDIEQRIDYLKSINVSLMSSKVDYYISILGSHINNGNENSIEVDRAMLTPLKTLERKLTLKQTSVSKPKNFKKDMDNLQLSLKANNYDRFSKSLLKIKGIYNKIKPVQVLTAKQIKRQERNKIILSIWPDAIPFGNGFRLSKTQRKYLGYKERIESKGKEITIPFKDFEYMLSQSCVYCGSTENITIDRIDSNLGYIPNNCAPCCHHCNTLKWDKSEIDFLNHIAKIAKFRNLL